MLREAILLRQVSLQYLAYFYFFIIYM